MPRGRKPTPTKVLELRGSWRAKEPKRRGEVQPPPASVTPPEWLTDRARQHWAVTVPLMVASGIVTTLDVGVWAMACTMWARAMELSDLIARDGMVLTNEETGTARMHPAIRAEEKAYAAYLRIAEQFGATPSGRVGLRVQVPEADELESFLARKQRMADAKKSNARFFTREP